MCDSGRVEGEALEAAAAALNRWTFAHYEKQVFSDLPDAAEACVSAYLAALGGVGPAATDGAEALTAEEAWTVLDWLAKVRLGDVPAYDSALTKLHSLAAGPHRAPTGDQTEGC